MTYRKGALIALTLTITLALAAVAQARPHGRGAGRGLLPPPGYLELTDEQLEAAKGIRQEAHGAVEPIRAEMRTLHQQLEAAFENDAPDATEVGRLTIDIHSQRQQLQAIRQDAESQFSALLTADQLERWENFKDLRGRRDGRRHRGGPGEPGGRFGQPDQQF